MRADYLTEELARIARCAIAGPHHILVGPHEGEMRAIGFAPAAVPRLHNESWPTRLCTGEIVPFFLCSG